MFEVCQGSNNRVKAYNAQPHDAHVTNVINQHRKATNPLCSLLRGTCILVHQETEAAYPNDMQSNTEHKCTTQSVQHKVYNTKCKWEMEGTDFKIV